MHTVPFHVSPRSTLVIDDETAFSSYRSWRWFYSIIECPSTLIHRRLQLILAWPYLRALFLVDVDDSLFVRQIQQIDEQYMAIQNEFLRFYRFYQNGKHDLIRSQVQYEFLCRRNQVLSQIDLFTDNKSEKNLKKYLQYWFQYERQLSNDFQQLRSSQVTPILYVYERSVDRSASTESRHVRRM